MSGPQVMYVSMGGTVHFLVLRIKMDDDKET